MAILMKILFLSQLPQTPQDILNIDDSGLTTTMYLMRSTISMVLKASLGAIAFSLDLLLHVPVVLEWQSITGNREAFLNNALLKSNQ